MHKGAHIWLDEVELKIGDSIIERIASAIAKTDFFLVLVSKSSHNSNWCRKELALAVNGELGRKGAKVLPVRIDGAPMPDVLAGVYYLELRAQTLEKIADQIIEAISKHVREQAGNDHDTGYEFANQKQLPRGGLADIRDLPLTAMLDLSSTNLDRALARVMGYGAVSPVPVAAFNSAI